MRPLPPGNGTRSAKSPSLHRVHQVPTRSLAAARCRRQCGERRRRRSSRGRGEPLHPAPGQTSLWRARMRTCRPPAMPATPFPVPPALQSAAAGLRRARACSRARSSPPPARRTRPHPTAPARQSPERPEALPPGGRPAETRACRPAGAWRRRPRRRGRRRRAAAGRPRTRPAPPSRAPPDAAGLPGSRLAPQTTAQSAPCAAPPPSPSSGTPAPLGST
mmetsp:Transcript_29524/g.95248  ORF Transcript_29524/g.95248 Transcript_29524/m.95248 type:complete len:219 (-) Transcript_29524:291-947(-)